MGSYATCCHITQDCKYKTDVRSLWDLHTSCTKLSGSYAVNPNKNVAVTFEDTAWYRLDVTRRMTNPTND